MELTIIVKDNKSYLSNGTKLNISVTPEKIPIFVARLQKGEVTDQTVGARKEKNSCCSTQITGKETGKVI